MNDDPKQTHRLSIFGMFNRPELPPRTLEEMREGMIEFLAEENERIKKEWNIQKQLRQSTFLS